MYVCDSRAVIGPNLGELECAKASCVLTVNILTFCLTKLLKGCMSTPSVPFRGFLVECRIETVTAGAIDLSSN